jgi:hypothetical protein
MAQAISHWLFTMEAWVRLQATILGVDCGQSGSGIGHPQSTLVFPFHYYIKPPIFHTGTSFFYHRPYTKLSLYVLLRYMGTWKYT